MNSVTNAMRAHILTAAVPYIKQYTDIQAVFISQDVLLTTQQERMLSSINVFTIPDCFFDFELREAGELW